MLRNRTTLPRSDHFERIRGGPKIDTFVTPQTDRYNRVDGSKAVPKCVQNDAFERPKRIGLEPYTVRYPLRKLIKRREVAMPVPRTPSRSHAPFSTEFRTVLTTLTAANCL